MTPTEPSPSAHPAAAVSPARVWAMFVLAGLALCLSLAALAWARPQDAAKAGVWWLLLGGSLLAICQAGSGRAAGRAWLLLCLVFGLDGAVQGVLRGFFGSQPQPSVLAEALANTTPTEAWGFVLGQRGPIALGGVYALVWMLLGWRGRRAWQRAGRRPHGRGTWVAIGLLATFTLLLHFNPTMLRSEPFLRWAVVAVRQHAARAELQQLQAQRQALWASRNQWQVRWVDPQPRTVVLFIGESANRMNWGLYGYARDTTAPLAQAVQALGGQWLLWRQARAAAAFTLPALRLALTPASAAEPELWRTTPDVVMLAQAAGYHVRWLSNQPGHEGWLASLGRSADAHAFINSGNWRDSSSEDEDLVPVLQQQLAPRAPVPTHELIVVHLLGQHFHYALRCGRQHEPYAGVSDDAVMRSLRAKGRSESILQARNAYDDATWCGARVLAQLLQTVVRARPGRALSALYFSDHGQEVGHTRDFAGHTEQDESGYSVPLWVWSNALAPLPAHAPLNSPISLDTLDQALQQLLALRSRWYDPRQDFLSAAFQGPRP